MMNSLEISRQLSNLVTETQPLPTRISYKRLMGVAEANKLLVAVGDAVGKSEGVPASYQEHYHRDKQLETNSFELLRNFLELCVINELPALTIKSFLPFPYVDSNIDIVAVDTQNVERYRVLIRQLGFVRQRNLADLREPRKEMYYHEGHGEAEHTYPKLHLHRAISWNGVVYLDLARVWQRHQYRNAANISIPIPSPEDELLIMAAHVMFENKYITLMDLVYLNWLTSQGLNWDYIIGIAQEYVWRDALELFLATAHDLSRKLEMNTEMNIPLPQAITFSNISFPLILPLSATLRVALTKMWHDVSRGQIKILPRQLFAYFPVDCLWMYRKARKKALAGKL